MAFFKTLTSKFIKTKQDPTATSPQSAIYEPEILRKELPNFAPMSRDDLIAFIKLYATEQSAFSASCKEYQKKVEERLEAAKKDEEELKSLKIYVDKCQEQLKLLTEENDKTIGLNNDLKDKVAELEKEVVELRAFKESVDSSQLGMDPKQKIIEQLQSDVKKKDELILNYEKKFEEFEEDTQDATGKFKAAEDRVVKLEKQVEKQKREMEEIRKENENLAFEKASEASTFSQDRIEFKKAASIAEKTISHLTKEKNSLEAKLALLQEKVEKSTKKGLAKETQTETSFTEDKGNHITGDEKSRLKSKLLQKEEELYTANNYSASLLQELKKMQDKFNQLQARDVGIERLLDEKVKMYQQLEREKNALLEENIELRKRRELAVSEITKLTQQISRKNTKPREAGRHLSEAVISTAQPGPNKGLSYEQELILNTRKNLDLLYKDLIRSIFRDPKDTSPAETLKAGGVIEAKLTSIIEKLADYCDDVLTPQKTSFLIAKVKPSEEKKAAVQSGGQPEGTAKKSPPIPFVQKYGPVPKEFSDIRSPVRKVNINGPVKILRDPNNKDK